MKTSPREARRVTYSTEIRTRKGIAFGDKENAVIIGCILGDGSLEENWSKTNYRLHIIHQELQLDYVRWKAQILNPWIISKPYHHLRTKSFRIRTISHSYLTKLRKIFYVGKRKVIPENISFYLRDPLTIAIWYMDDGNIIKRKGLVQGVHLNTHCFSKDENIRLIKALS